MNAQEAKYKLQVARTLLDTGMIRPVRPDKALRTLYPGQATLESRALLERWGHLHAIRTVFGIASMALLAWAATD